MANGKGDINGEITVDAQKAVNALNQLINKLAALEASGPEAARAIDKVEKSAAGIAASLSNGTKAVHQQADAIQSLITQYRALGKEGLKGTGGITQTLNNAVGRSVASNDLENALAKQNKAWLSYGRNVVAARDAEAKATTQAAEATRKYNVYARESNDRIRAAEAKALADANKIVTQQITAETRAREASASAVQKYNDYVRASNTRVQVAESKALADAKKQVTQQTLAETQAKKADQAAAYASYAGNIRAAQQSSQAVQGLANQRYALYDVATTLGAISAALLGVAGASVKTAISYEKAFAQVERTTTTTAKGLNILQDQLLQLSTELPASFEDIAGVASLGGQLNVANGSLENFTETVIKFGATSNVSLDQSATALARLAQITDAGATDGAQAYEKLASAILLTGVNSIATESQIVAVTTQIATAGDLAGFSADQIIGLASAFSSLNIAPERARGTVQRVFGQITAAVDSGGTSLENFSRVSGMTADQFSKEWQTNAQGAFSAFVNGLEQMQNAGQDTNAALKQLGIGAVRDIQALQALANNSELYAKALKDSAVGYKEGSELSRQYAITAATLAARFTQLGSTFRTITAEAQGGVLAALSGVLDVVQGLADAFHDLSGNGAAVTIGTIVLAGTALVGMLAAVRAAGALATASLYALQTAEAGLAGGALRTTGSVNALSIAMGKLIVGTRLATAAQSAYTASLAAGSGKVVAAAAGLRGMATAATAAGTGLKMLASATIWTAALTAGITLLTQFAQKNEEARGRVDALAASLDAQTASITEQTRVQAAQQLQESGALKTANELGISRKDLVAAALGEAGAQQKVQAQYDATIKTMTAYADTLDLSQGTTRESADALNFLGTAGKKFDKIMGQVGGTSKELNDAIARQKELLEASGTAAKEASDSEIDFSNSLQQTISDAGAYIDGTLGMQNATYALGQSLAENGKQFDLYSASGRANFAALQQVISSMVTAAGGDATSLATYLEGLMQSLVAMGVTGADALNLVKSSIAAIGGTANVDFNALKQSALDTGSALSGGYSAGMQKATKATKSAGSAAQDTAKEVRTLSDYAEDLRNITDRAFELRFEVETTKDALADAWADAKAGVKKAAEDDPFSASDFFNSKTYKRAGKDAILTAFRDLQDEARETALRVKQAAADIKDAMADMAGLKADRSVLEYQLKIAQKYGDALRAQQIQAELAKNTADQAKAAADLAAAQEASRQAAADQNKTLKGNSQAAVNNRNKVRGLLGTYTDYIQSLIDGGASQETINKAIAQATTDFKAQGQALGYSGAELQAYVDILTGMKTGFNNANNPQKQATKNTQNQAQAARDARDAMRDLTKKQQDYIQALIDSGAPQSTVKQAIEDGKDELRRQATQLGLTKKEAQNYAGALDDVAYAMSKVPKNLTIKTNLDPAKRALAEWKAEKTVKVKFRAPSSIGSVGANIVPRNRNIKLDRIIAALVDANMLDVNSIWSHGKNVSGKIGAVKAATGGLIPQYRASGGVAGVHPGRPSGTDTVPAWLSPGEYVVRAAAVRAAGLPFMNAINGMQNPKYLAGGGGTGGGFSMPGVIMVELSPTDRQLLAAAGDVTLTVNGKVLASTVNGVNANNTTRNAS